MLKKQLITIIGVILFFSCGVIPRTGTPHSDRSQTDVADYRGSEALFYHSEGIKARAVHSDDERAMEYFRKAIESDSLYDAAYFEIAELLMAKDPAEALVYSRRAGALDSVNLDYKSQLGRGLLFTGDYDNALDVYTDLMREDSHNPLNYNMLAALYEYKKQPFTAISILDSAEYKLGRIEELSSFKRQLLISVRLYDKAIEESRALIADYPYDDGNYLVLAQLYSVMGRDSLALANFGEALRIDSTNVQTLLGLGEFYKARGNERGYLSMIKKVFESDGVDITSKVSMFREITASIDYYRANYFAINSLATTLLVKYPQDYSILDLYATHLIRSGEAAAALDLYKGFIENNPDSLKPYYAVIDIESYLQHPDSVTKYSDMALQRFTDNTDLYMRKGFSLDYMEDYDGAFKAFRKALKFAPDDSTRSVVMGVIGDSYHKSGHQAKSFKYYDKALRLDPENNGVLNNYAYYLSELDRDLEKALEMSEKANQLSPSNATYLDTHAWILYKLGRYDQAKKFMLQAVSLDRDGSDVLLMHYGDILYELKEYFMARIYWKRALEKGADSALIEERLKWSVE